MRSKRTIIVLKLGCGAYETLQPISIGASRRYRLSARNVLASRVSGRSVSAFFARSTSLP